MGKLYPCGRCKAPEDIPTHQFVKFDQSGDPKYLCGHCFEMYRGFISKEVEPRKMAENAGHRKREWIPENQFVKDGVDNKQIRLTSDEWTRFRSWYFSGKGIDSGETSEI